MSETQKLQAALQQWKDAPLAPVAWQIPLQRLLDDDYCTQVTNLLSQQSVGWECMKATPNLWKQLPRHRGVYMFVWRPILYLGMENGQNSQLFLPVYVGKAGGVPSNNTLDNRYKTEYRAYLGDNPKLLWTITETTHRVSRLKRYLQLRPLEFWFLPTKDAESADCVESHLLNTLSPPANSRPGAMARLKPPQPAF